MRPHIGDGGRSPGRWQTFSEAIISWPLTLRLSLLLAICEAPVIVYLIVHR